MDFGAQVICGLVTGSIGAGYFVYGKKQGHISSLVCGLILCVYPMFVNSLFVMLVVGLILMAAPFLIGG